MGHHAETCAPSCAGVSFSCNFLDVAAVFLGKFSSDLLSGPHVRGAVNLRHNTRSSYRARASWPKPEQIWLNRKSSFAGFPGSRRTAFPRRLALVRVLILTAGFTPALAKLLLGLVK